MPQDPTHLSPQDPTYIGTQIHQWYLQHARELPWRDTFDPYKIWLAEIILQQTRIQQGIKYYYRFLERFPDVDSLAKGEIDEVLKYWEGLGYYSRARNLHATAKHIVENLSSTFPDHHSELIKLKGVGPYTARAIGSFAFGNVTGVIDGNVLRVMSRVLGDHSAINEVSTRNKFQLIIDDWVAQVPPREFNHGIMDIGATICTPTQPACMICPLESTCVARAKGLTHVLPYKPKKLKRKIRFYQFYLCKNQKGEIAVRKRPESGLWGGLWEVPHTEVSRDFWLKKEDEAGGTYSGELKHVFTHFDMMIHVYDITGDSLDTEGFQFISTDKIAIFAFPKAILTIFDLFLFL